MLRILVALVLAFSVPLQGLANGDAGVSGPDVEVSTFETEYLGNAVVETLEAPCCQSTGALETGPSLCKSDCKAVMPGLTLAPRQVIHDYGAPFGNADRSFKATVDPRPPMS